jgi:Flp pilus assembly protein TadD
VLNDLGESEAAVDSCKTAIALDATAAAPQLNLAVALTALHRLPEAEAAYLRALMLEPDRAETHRSLGMLLAEMERYDEALLCHDRAVKLRPGDAAFHCARAGVLILRRELEPAVEGFRRAVALDPKHVQGWIGLGWALRLLGRFEESDKCLARVRELDPTNLEAVRHQTATGRSTGDDDEIVRLAGVLDQPDLGLRDRAIAGFALGKLLDNADRYDEAFARYADANRAWRSLRADAGERFDFADLKRRIDLLIETHTPEYFADNQSTNRSELPVFIVGMPRSGTSLVEQIAASHSRVFGAGELPDIDRIAMSVAGATEHTTASYEGNPARAGRLAAVHIDRLRRIGGDAQRVTDKMPDNVAHLGLIAVLFPGARVIFCTRDPRDISLSCYFQLFSEGLQTFSYDLADCGRRCLEVERLVAHWRSVLPLRMHEVRYEKLVADLEGESRKLIDFLGLDWEPACLEFHRTERMVATVSHWQVRQPIYDRSVGRWRHYRRHLGPLFEVLGPAGYPAE